MVGVMPPKAIFGRSWLHTHIHRCGMQANLIKVPRIVARQPFVAQFLIGVLLGLARFDALEAETPDLT